MKLCLNACLLSELSLEDQLTLAHRAGCNCIDLVSNKLRQYITDQDLQQLKSLVSGFPELAPYSIYNIAGINFGHSEQQQRVMDDCRFLSEVASEIGCNYIILTPGLLPDKEITHREVKAETVNILREMAHIALRYDIGLALEFPGFEDSSISRLSQALDIIYKTDRNNVGIAIDTFHFYIGESRLEVIEGIDQRRLYAVYIGDANEKPRPEMTEQDRIIPGPGVIPNRQILSELLRIGYTKPFSIKLPIPTGGQDVLELASQCIQGAKDLLS